MIKSFVLGAFAASCMVAAPGAQAATTITGAGAGVVIPYGTSTQTSSINISSLGTVSSVVFTLSKFAHGAMRDLTIGVTHNGVTATLLSGASGLSGLRPLFGSYSFTSDATTLLKNGSGFPAVDSGTYQYVYNLPGSSFAGQSVAGAWDLTITDNRPLHAGILKGWSLSVSAVPEPATWAMMLAGFAAVGSAMRRRSTRVAFA